MENIVIKNNSIVKPAVNNGVFGSVQLFDFIHSPDFRELVKRVRPNRANAPRPDKILTSLIEEKGFNALPIIVDKDKYSLLIESKLTRIYRGVCYRDAINDFAYNTQMYVSKGMYCSGVYFVYGDIAKDTAESYMIMHTPPMYCKGHYDGAIIEAVVSADAKIIDIEDAYKLQEKMVNKIDSMSNLSDNAKNKLMYLLSDDVSKCALLNGYDAINIKSKQYLVVLNRNKLIMQTPKARTRE